MTPGQAIEKTAAAANTPLEKPTPAGPGKHLQPPKLQPQKEHSHPHLWNKNHKAIHSPQVWPNVTQCSTDAKPPAHPPKAASSAAALVATPQNSGQTSREWQLTSWQPQQQHSFETALRNLAVHNSHWLQKTSAKTCDVDLVLPSSTRGTK